MDILEYEKLDPDEPSTLNKYASYVKFPCKVCHNIKQRTDDNARNSS